MKKCPFCAEEIQEAAIKCRYCGSQLSGAPATTPTVAPAPMAPPVRHLQSVTEPDAGRGAESTKTSMKCPKCGLLNPPSALRCDCGWDFADNAMKESYLDANIPHVAKSGFGRIDLVGWVSIILGASSFVIGVLVLSASGINDSLRFQAATKSLTFAALAAAYGLALVKRKKVALGQGWFLIPFLGAGLTPLGLICAGLVLWFTQYIRRQPQLFG